MRRINQNVYQYLTGKNSLGKVNKSRVDDYLRTRFPTQGHEKKPVGLDKRILELAKQYELQDGFVEKIAKHLKDVDYGPRQVAGSHEANLEAYCRGHAAPFTWNRNYQRAVAEVMRITAPRKPLAPISLRTDREIKDALPREDTHAGISYLETGLRRKGEYLEGIAERLETEQDQALKMGTFEKPLIIGERYQCSGGYAESGEEMETVKYKTRTIHMYDVYMALTELGFSKPAQRHLGYQDLYAGGKKPNDLWQIIYKYRHTHEFWMSVDYSKYDQTLPGWLIEGGFRVVRSWFGKFDCRTEGLWNLVVNDFIHKGFVGPCGDILYSDDGVPSGSMFTQIIDTLCNLIMLQTFAYSQGWEKPLRCNICGDDNLIFHDGWFKIEDYASYLKHNFGVECHPDKCAQGTWKQHPEYLSRFWTNTNIYRNPNVLLSKMMYPERFRDYVKNKDLSAELIFYSYFLAYPGGMKEAFDMDSFLRDKRTHVRGQSARALSELPGFLQYQVRYEGLKL